jgi:hypothetical protein
LVLTRADSLNLFCTCTTAFYRFSPIEPIEFAKSFENSPIVADRLPPPPPTNLFYREEFPISVDPVANMLPPTGLPVRGASSSRIASSTAAGLTCMYRWVVFRS